MSDIRENLKKAYVEQALVVRRAQADLKWKYAKKLTDKELQECQRIVAEKYLEEVSAEADAAEEAQARMKFKIIDPKDGSSVLGSTPVPYINPHVSQYGVVLDGHKEILDLNVGEKTSARYAMSGQKPTVYSIVRVE